MKDKRYRKCMSEIMCVLRKYDMAGAVTVVDRERAMFKYTFPTWSVISVGEDHIRFKSKRQDFTSEEQRHVCTELSAHIIMQMRDIAANTFMVMNEMGKVLAEKIGMEHTSYSDFDPEHETEHETEH